MNATKKALLTGALFVISFSCFAQSSRNTIDSTAASLIRSIRATQTESCFLTTDKSLYRTGEPIWLRVFLLRSASEKLSGVSKNIFVDLVDGNDSVMATLLLNAANAQLGARLNTSAVKNTGYYWIRAYTKFMAEQD